jgi:hypothetical protein
MVKYRNVQMALFRRWDATVAQIVISCYIMVAVLKLPL